MRDCCNSQKIEIGKMKGEKNNEGNKRDKRKTYMKAGIILVSLVAAILIVSAADVVVKQGSLNVTDLTASGKVGIGTSSPNQVKGLHLDYTGVGSYGFVTSTDNMHASSNAYYDGSWKYITANKASQIILDNDGSILFRNTDTTGTTNGTLAFLERVRIGSSGNVGIGTTIPSAKLHLQDSIKAGLKLTKTGTGGGNFDIYHDGAANINAPGSLYVRAGGPGNAIAYIYTTQLQLRDSTNTEKIRLATTGNSWFNSGGKIGIGTSTPGAKLEVAGDIKISNTEKGSGAGTQLCINSNNVICKCGKC